jgi:mRNA interferase MazF
MQDQRFINEQFERGEEKRMEELHDMFSKPFGKWTELKRSLEELSVKHNFNEREIWWCSLGINIGYEQDGKHEMFERPVLILRKYSKDFLLIAPFTSAEKDGGYYFPVTFCGKKSRLILSQQRAVSAKRLSRKMSIVGRLMFGNIVKSIVSINFKAPL